MVNTRYFIVPDNTVHEMKIRARVYHSNQYPHQVLVPTRCSLPAKYIGPRYPYAESVLADSKIQPYVHDCLVTVTESDKTYRFRVFYKIHAKLRQNRYLLGLRGSMFVMRAGALEHHSVVNMRERDVILADFLVKKLARSIHHARITRKSLPNQITFHKSL